MNFFEKLLPHKLSGLYCFLDGLGINLAFTELVFSLISLQCWGNCAGTWSMNHIDLSWSLNLRVEFCFTYWYLLCVVCDVVGGMGHSRPIVHHSSLLWCLDNLTFHRATWHLHSSSYFILSSQGSCSTFFYISYQTMRHLHPLGIGHGSQYPTLTNKGLCSIVYHWNID